jgi:hypothetical protein
VVTLRPGTAAVFTDGMDFPVLTRMPDGTTRETITPVVAPVTEVVGRTHGACGPDCATRPCTLEQIDTARQLLVDEPAIVLWAELAVLAHLTGHPLPVPRAELMDRVGALNERLRSGAIGLAVGDAVHARSALLARTHSPEEFSQHVVGDLRAFSDGWTMCYDEPWPWLAVPYRWSLMVRSLLITLRRGDGATRHPESQVWERVSGGPIPGCGCQEQLEYVGPRSVEAIRDPVFVEAVLFGLGTPSALEVAIGTSRHESNWLPFVVEALRPFDVMRNWAEGYLTPGVAGWGRAATDTPESPSR